MVQNEAKSLVNIIDMSRYYFGPQDLEEGSLWHIAMASGWESESLGSLATTFDPVLP